MIWSCCAAGNTAEPRYLGVKDGRIVQVQLLAALSLSLEVDVCVDIVEYHISLPFKFLSNRFWRSPREHKAEVTFELLKLHD